MSFASVPVEQVRDYWDRRPCNIRHSDEPTGSRAYFDEVEWRKYTVEPHIPEFADFPAYARKSVLEIGCGIGTDTINFARSGAQVTATDLSRESLGIAMTRALVFGQRIEFAVGNGEELSSSVLRRADSFDLVYSFGVIHHSPHPERIVAQAFWLLKQGGTLKLMVYHRRSWKVAWIILRYGHGRFWRAAELVAKHSEAQTGCPITYTYTRRQARQLVAAFEDVKIRVDHIFPYRIGPYTQHRLSKTWYWRLVPRSVFRLLERRFGWHLMITATKGTS